MLNKSTFDETDGINSSRDIQTAALRDGIMTACLDFNRVVRTNERTYGVIITYTLKHSIRTFVLFFPCTVHHYSLLVPTNARIILIIYISHIWLLHVSAGHHPQAAHNQIAVN